MIKLLLPLFMLFSMASHGTTPQLWTAADTVTTRVHVREAPTTKSKVIGYIYRANVVRVPDSTAKHDGFVKVELSNHVTGYVALHLIQPISKLRSPTTDSVDRMKIQLEKG